MCFHMRSEIEMFYKVTRQYHEMNNASFPRWFGMPPLSWSKFPRVLEAISGISVVVTFAVILTVVLYYNHWSLSPLETPRVTTRGGLPFSLTTSGPSGAAGSISVVQGEGQTDHPNFLPTSCDGKTEVEPREECRQQGSGRSTCPGVGT